MRVEIVDLLKNHIIKKASCCGMQFEALQRELERQNSNTIGVVKNDADNEEPSGTT